MEICLGPPRVGRKLTPSLAFWSFIGWVESRPTKNAINQNCKLTEDDQVTLEEKISQIDTLYIIEVEYFLAIFNPGHKLRVQSHQFVQSMAQIVQSKRTKCAMQMWFW